MSNNNQSFDVIINDQISRKQELIEGEISKDMQEQQPIYYTLGFKLILIALYGCFMMVFRIYCIPVADVPCMIDLSFEITAPINEEINQNHLFAKFMIVSTSLFIDFFSILLTYHWITKGRSIRLFIVFFAFYIIRSIHLFFHRSRFPTGFYFSDPGFPSLTVPYGRQSDFYFSGHCGMLMISFLELSREKFTKIRWVNLFALCWTAFSLICLRAHYFIDISAGIFWAHYIYQNVEKNDHLINQTGITIQKYLGEKIQIFSSTPIQDPPKFNQE